MAEELRWVLILVSAVVIGGLLIHGLWSVRKKHQEQTPPKAAKPPIKEPKREPTTEAVRQTSVQHNDTLSQPKEAPVQDAPLSAPLQNELSQDELSFSAADDEPSHATWHDTDESAPQDEQGAPSAEQAPQASDFIILHVHMPEGLSMQGRKLLPLILTLGFKFDENEGFFNRHQDPSGQGAVLFRMVNMYNPGTFDIDNMEQFSTAGISLFMTLPCEGDSLAAFNMLHSAAKKIAEEFGAKILDSERKELSVDAVRQYVEKIRDISA